MLELKHVRQEYKNSTKLNRESVTITSKAKYAPFL